MADKPKKLSNLTGFKDITELKNYITDLDRDVRNIMEYLDRFPRSFEQSAEPTIQRNTFAFWKDTDDSKYYLLKDFGTTTKKVELT